MLTIKHLLLRIQGWAWIELIISAVLAIYIAYQFYNNPLVDGEPMGIAGIIIVIRVYALFRICTCSISAEEELKLKSQA